MGAMNMETAWQDVLARPRRGHHIAQVYQDVDFLTEAVDLFVGAGLRQGEGVVIIARKEHRRVFLERMERNGRRVRAAMERGQLIFLDATDVLSTFMSDGAPDGALFRRTMRGVLDPLQAFYPMLRVYDEMVDVVLQDGRKEEAFRLEELWSDLGSSGSFSLLCGYLLDNTEESAYEGVLQEIVRTHSHLIPARDYRRFDRAVNRASREVLGESMSGMLRSMANVSDQPPASMPGAQAALLWARKNMPLTAHKILTRLKP
jgi:hypothetical protein